jgi:hypothetical protein
MKGVPQPLPDPQRPMHYMDVSVTPTHTEGGEEREADDWQPRANITKMFNTESIFLDQEDLITEFSDKFYVKREYVVNYIQHLTNLHHTKGIRARQRARDKVEREGKDYDDYNWLDLVVNGKLKSLKVVELDKYLDKNKLSKKGKKADKVNAITVDVLRKKQNDTIEKVIEETGSDYNSDTGINSDSDEDVILDEFGDDTSSESDEEVDQTAAETADVESLPWLCELVMDVMRDIGICSSLSEFATFKYQCSIYSIMCIHCELFKLLLYCYLLTFESIIGSQWLLRYVIYRQFHKVG